ncbi:CDC27 family protein [Anaerovibrio lipolyticus]|uniref:tetratricopeptide repeat protein n=1 Tax=Anaerovibrio lipolyticus TaxID=82374 RepID=UPI0023F0E209|nr:CDC27 family protein [Anaerovibrio lipolyticus]
MGSFKNKINNKKKKKMEAEALNELIALKNKMKEQFAAGEYVEAMDTMAELAEHKKMDPEVMLMGATCYFMTGDSERAIKWVNNTLAYAPNNVGARILLGRICLTQEKQDKGFEVLSFVVDNQQAAMGEEDKKHLMEILNYCHDNMSDIMAKYPSVVEYYNDNLAELPKQDNGISKAQAAVDRLKALLNKSKGNNDTKGTKTTKATSDSQQSASEPAKKADDVSASGQTEASGESVDDIIKKVMDSELSLRDKVKSLNTFASGLYLNEDYHGALKLLKKALEIDSHDPFVLRNIAYVCVDMKDNEKALTFAKALPMVDFALLRSIKGH